MMMGLGEEQDEVVEVFKDLRKVGVSILTLGQYLRPSENHAVMTRYYHPDEFRELKRIAMGLGFVHVEAGPLVRSSYHAHEQADAAQAALQPLDFRDTQARPDEAPPDEHASAHLTAHALVVVDRAEALEQLDRLRIRLRALHRSIRHIDRRLARAIDLLHVGALRRPGNAIISLSPRAAAWCTAVLPS